MCGSYYELLSKFEYADVRIEKRKDASIRQTNDELKVISGSSYGIGVRVFETGSWGFSSTNKKDEKDNWKSIEDLLRKAQSAAKIEGGNIKLTLPKEQKKYLKAKLHEVNLEDKIKAIKDITKEMKGSKIISKTVNCSDSVIESEFHSSIGSEILRENSFTYLSAAAVAKDGEKIQRGSSRSCSRAGFGKLEIDIGLEASQKAERLLYAKSPPKGKFTVVLDPEMTGVLSHEAVGHATEADSVLDRESILSGKISQRIGNELVSITDDPLAADFGFYQFDDEGVEAKTQVLLEKGILKGYLTSMESAGECGYPILNGHARADGYDKMPIVRMSNTYFQKGTSKKQEVFDLKSGIYLKGMKGGSVDIFSGGFMFKAEEAYEIKNGEEKDLLSDVTITGNILQTLMDVECVGNDFGTSPGICGKFGQSAPVSDGGPHIRIRNVSIG